MPFKGFWAFFVFVVQNYFFSRICMCKYYCKMCKN